MAWSADGTWVAIGRHGEIALLETGSWKIQARFEVEDLVNALAIDPAGRVAVATSGSILTVRSPDGELLHRLDGHLSSISAVGWTADERLFSGGYDGQVIRWDLDGNQPALTVDPGPGAVRDLAIDGDELMTVTSVGSLAWHLHTTGQTRCRVALDTALSSCSLPSRGVWLRLVGSWGWRSSGGCPFAEGSDRIRRRRINLAGV